MTHTHTNLNIIKCIPDRIYIIPEVHGHSGPWIYSRTTESLFEKHFWRELTGFSCILAAPRALHDFGFCHTQSCAGSKEAENKTKHNQTTFTVQIIRTLTEPLASLRVKLVILRFAGYEWINKPIFWWKWYVLTFMLYIIHLYNSHHTNTRVCNHIILILFQQFILIFISINLVYNICQWNIYIWWIK